MSQLMHLNKIENGLKRFKQRPYRINLTLLGQSRINMKSNCADTVCDFMKLSMSLQKVGVRFNQQRHRK